MSPETYGQILLASLAGGFTGVLVMWNRKRSQKTGANQWRQWTVLILGTAATACSWNAFTKAFAGHSSAYAVVVMILITSWAAVLQSTVPLPFPPFVLRVQAGEFAILRSPWTGVRLFGALLRNTPLRSLGGPVYLTTPGQDLRTALRGIHDAEKVHLAALLFCCPWLVFWAAQGRWMSVICAFAVHVPLNLYPILHLRYATGRIEGHLARTRGSENAQRTRRGLG